MGRARLTPCALRCWLAASGAVLVLTALPGAARAFSLGEPLGQPASLDSTWTLHLHAHGENGDELDDNDDYADLLSIYNLQGRWGQHRLGLRLDALRFFAPPTGQAVRDAGSADYADEYVLEKVSYGWRRGGLQLGLGDQYVTLGRGLVLSLRKEDELGVDTSLRGGLAQFDSRWFRATALAGYTNAANLDPVNERLRFSSCSPTLAGGPGCDPLAIDPADLLVGARAEGRVPGWGSLGFSELLLRRADESEGVLVHGASLEIPALPFRLGELYAEGALLATPAGAGDDGVGLYAAYTGGFGPVSLLVEGKHYSAFLLQTALSVDARYSPDRTVVYNEPPSLEPNRLIPYDNVDATGGRIQASLAVDATDSVVSLTVAGFRTGPEASRRQVRHVYGGIEQRFAGGSRADLSLGARSDLPEEGTPGAERRVVHSEGKVVVPVTGPHSASLAWTLLYWRQLLPGQPEEKDYRQGDLILAWSWAPTLSASLILGYDDEFDTRTNPTLLREQEERYRAGLDADPALAEVAVRQVYFAGEVTWYPAEWLVLQALAGSLRGGPKCLSSVCRVYPPFSGARAEATVRF